MNYWEGPARWVNTALLVVLAFISFDTLFRLLNANPENVIVGFVAAIASLFLAPFQGMFADQEYLLTALIAVLGYSLLAGIVLAIIRSVQASRRDRVRRRERNPAPADPPDGQGYGHGYGYGETPPSSPGSSDQTQQLNPGSSDRTQQL